MGVKYTKLSEYEELKETSLQVCNSESEHFSVLQYKAQGILLYSHERDYKGIAIKPRIG